MSRQTHKTLESSLQDAIEGEAMSIVFQPIVNLADRQVVGYEALARLSMATRARTRPCPPQAPDLPSDVGRPSPGRLSWTDQRLDSACIAGRALRRGGDRRGGVRG